MTAFVVMYLCCLGSSSRSDSGSTLAKVGASPYIPVPRGSRYAHSVVSIASDGECHVLQSSTKLARTATGSKLAKQRNAVLPSAPNPKVYHEGSNALGKARFGQRPPKPPPRSAVRSAERQSSARPHSAELFRSPAQNQVVFEGAGCT